MFEWALLTGPLYPQITCPKRGKGDYLVRREEPRLSSHCRGLRTLQRWRALPACPLSLTFAGKVRLQSFLWGALVDLGQGRTVFVVTSIFLSLSVMVCAACVCLPVLCWAPSRYQAPRRVHLTFMMKLSGKKQTQQFPPLGRTEAGLSPLWLQSWASFHQAIPPLGGSVSNFRSSFIPYPCDSRMLCIQNFFVSLILWVSTLEHQQEHGAEPSYQGGSSLNKYRADGRGVEASQFDGWIPKWQEQEQNHSLFKWFLVCISWAFTKYQASLQGCHTHYLP